MFKGSLLGFLRPSKWLGGFRRRGARGAITHALRRTGTATGHAWVGPALIRINPMWAFCNHACPMCWINHTPPERIAEQRKAELRYGLRLRDYEELFRNMPWGLEEVNVVGGGEPLVHPDALKIMMAIKARRWRGTIITNGTLLKYQIAKQLVEIGWDQVRVSVHAGDRDTYRRVHGVDQYDVLIENLKVLDQLRRDTKIMKPKIVIAHVIQRANYNSIDELFAMAGMVGADEIAFDKVIAFNPEDRLTESELNCAMTDLEKHDIHAVLWNREFILDQLASEQLLLDKPDKEFRPGGFCSVGFDQAFITSTGDVLPCCFSSEIMGNLHDQSFAKIWRGKPYQNFRRRLINGRFAQYCFASHCAMQDVLHGRR